MLYELINPSDETHFEAPNLMIAALVTVMLGQGQYQAKPEDETAEEVPFFMFGGFDEWWAEHFPDEQAEGAGDRHATELAAALRSVCYGDLRERCLYDRALNAIDDPGKRAAFIADWNDKHRSSLNNIMGRAHAMAGGLESRAAAFN